MVHFDGYSILEKNIFGYKFIDNYLLNRYLDSDKIRGVVLELMEEFKNIDEHKDTENSLSYNKLYRWWELEDREIIILLDEVSQELSKLKYHPRYFKDIIIILMQLEHFGFRDIDFGKFIPFMKLRLEKLDDSFSVQALQLLSDDTKFIKQYNQIAHSLFNVLENKDRKEKEKINESLNLDESWGNKFYQGCCKNRESYIEDRKFFFYIDPSKVISRLQDSSVKDIYLFLEGINEIYNFSNLNDFFKEDVQHIKKVLSCFKIEDLSGKKITKKIALEKLQIKLEDSIKLILK